MPKFAIFKDADWIKDVHADSAIEAIKQDDTANRAELISESDEKPCRN
jgi:hypothetical protein